MNQLDCSLSMHSKMGKLNFSLVSVPVINWDGLGSDQSNEGIFGWKGEIFSYW